MTVEDRRIAAGIVIAICLVVLIDTPVIAVVAPGYVRWSHVLVLVAAAAAFALGALAYLRGTRVAGPARTPEEINTAYYLNMAAWKQPVVFAGSPQSIYPKAAAS